MRSILAVALATVFGLTSCSHSAAGSLEERTGLSFCAEEAGHRLTTLTNALLYVEQPRGTCWVWDEALPGTEMRIARSAHAEISLPVVVAYHKDQNVSSGSSRILLRVVGGPGGNIAPQAWNSLYTDMLGSGDLLITPAYEGTYHGSLYPGENYTAAAARIAFWLTELRRRNKDAEIVLIGESLGGAIALEATRMARTAPPDRLVLVSPLAYSAQLAQANFTQMRGAEYRNDRKIALRTFTKESGRFDQGRWIQVYSTDVFKTFFAPAQRTTDLNDRLVSVTSTPTLVIYGADDKVAGTPVLDKLEPSPGLTVRRIDGMGHVVDPAHASAVSRTIEAFLHRR